MVVGALEIALVTHDAKIVQQRNRKLVHALTQRGVDVRVVAPGRETVRIRGAEVAFFDSTGRRVQPDLVVNALYRNSGWGLDLVRAFELAGYPVVNRAEAWHRAKMKHLTGAALAAAGVAQPPVVFSHGLPRGMWRRVRWLGRRIVLKPWNSALGQGSIRYRRSAVTPLRLRRWRRKHGSVYAQAFVPNPGRDIRVMVVGDEAIGATYRIARRGRWKTNVTAGGIPAPCPVTADLAAISLAAAKSLGLDIAGVDVIEGPHGYEILEVNAWPNYHRFDQVAGVDVADRIAALLMDRANKDRSA